MTFEDWIAEYPYEVNVCVKADMKQAWEAGVQEGIDRMHRLYDICPQCKLPSGQHKMDCGRGR
jgi:hypothetical protein